MWRFRITQIRRFGILFFNSSFRMLKDFKFIRRNSGKTEEIENVPVDPKDSTAAQSIADSSRPPLNTIQDPFHIPKAEQDLASQNKINRTPKAKGKVSEPTLPLRTPDKLGGSLMAKSRFGWAQKNEPTSVYGDLRDDRRGAADTGNGGLANATPRTASRPAGRATMSCSESNSTQSTPSKSVTKPPNSSIRSKADGNFNARLGNYAALYKGIPSSSGPLTVVNTVEVPHFDLKEDTSFWINHNVQVIIRVRPLNSMERATQGYKRCLKQESAHSITWIGQPETRFTFDHVGCETIDQEILFRMAGLPMVENCLSGYNSCMFAYGQTGSGKTYTMLGEIEDLDVKPSPHRGMTPRIFEFLFARIQAEEESRRDENLKYNCKCSFLEIYNEQVTDLLDPSSTNLLLREDVKKGVYVENLSEFEVHTVSDIIRLLTQGSANRKVAATNMNRESSRSHCVFTCVIESRWEKDSTTNFRFARLNLVDLAGSERQKTSGADGERLKEAANINKSLSTLGHVIMILVDVAQGKMRHIPYRDSKLTFLLQDSLGGNSKTMIIANVSPSICCAAETLNTLKFAQRAKLIQNNAVVNEDSSGDVIALQQQIQFLKEELSTLKHQNVSRSLSFGLAPVKVMKESLEGSCSEKAFEVEQQHGESMLDCQSKGIRMSSKQLKSLEATLAGALRREQMAETSIKQLEAEIEQLNRLVRQREEDARSCKMMLRFREDKIRRMESLLAGSIPIDGYLQEENKALSDEIQLLQSKLDRNPEVTRFALENIRLLDQLRRFQEFYEEGEREILLAELSSLRDQLLQFHERNSMQSNPNFSPQPQKVQCNKKEDDSVNLELRNTLNELEECRRNLNSCLEENAKLSREIDSLHSIVSSINATQDCIKGPSHEAEAIPPKMMKGRSETPISNEEEMDEIRRQAEAETAEAIVCMQEELATLQHQIHDSHLREIEMKERIQHLESELKEVQEALFATMNDRGQLSEELEVRDQELRSLAEECELLTSEIEEILADGCDALLDASDQVDHICNSFPQKRIWISEQVGMMVRKISEKELLIDELSRCLEDASNKRSDMECMLKCLRSAALVITEAHQKECVEKDKEIHLLTSQLNDKISTTTKLEGQLKLAEEHIRKASNCATVAFVIVSRLSEVNLGCLDDLKQKDLLLSELAEINQRKDVLLKDQSTSIVQAERHIAELQESCDNLRQNLFEEQEHSCVLEQRLKGIEKNAISDTREQLAALQEGVSSIRSSMASYAEHSERLDSKNSLEVGTQHFEENGEERTGTGAYQDNNLDANSVEESIIDLADCSFNIVESGNNTENQKSKKLCKDGCARDVTITLLKKEIESALGSLKEVQDEMARLHKEKKEMSMSEKQSQQSIKCLTTELLALQVATSDFEEQSKIKIEALSDKVKELEETLKEDGRLWHQSKEGLELEVGEAKTIAAQKAAEASCILAKFEEAQETMKEADIMINELMIANESMKHDIERLKETEVILLNEKDLLLSEKESSLSVINIKNKEIEDIVESNLIETKNILAVLDDVIKEFQSAVKENFISLGCDFQCIKSQFSHSTKLLQSWLEKVWSEIVVKDCTLSVLHLCHIGILLETVTGLHTENGLLSHGLCESNSLISDLKEHNSKTRKELEMFSILKRKLLADIKNSFDRISSKEKEAGEITINLNSFEKKISDLQLQEEMMLQRSKEMEAQLAELMRELDFSNTDVVTSLLDQEQILEQKVEVLESQADFFMASWYCKDFESLIFALELENLACQIAHKEDDLMMCSKLSEHLKKEVICFQLEAEFAAHILMDMEVEVSVLKGEIQQKEVEKKDLLSELNQNVLKIAAMGEVNKSLQQHIEFLEDGARSNNALKGQLGKITEDKKRLMEKNLDLETEYDKTTENLIEKDVALTLFYDQITILDQQNKELHEVNQMLEKSSGRLQNELNIRNEKLDRLHSLGDENESLRNEVENLKIGNSLVLQSLDKRISDFKPLSRCQDLFDKENCLLHDFTSSLEFHINSLQTDLETETTKLSDILDSQSVTIEELSFKCQEFQNYVATESASECKDHKDEIEEMGATIEALEDDLAVKSGELAAAVANCQMFEAQLQDKSDIIASLELNLSREEESVKSLASENWELKDHIERAFTAKRLAEGELTEKRTIVESLENEISEMSSALTKMNELATERDHLQLQVLSLKEKLEMAKAEVEESEAIAQEAQQMAESRKVYAEDKEEEVKLLERSVEELECTINVLENKVDIVKGEAERQRLQREELELELHAVKLQMQNITNADADIRRLLDEKTKSLEEALDHIQVLKRDLMGKDAEISQMKAHISELNLHAEAQAKEYKQKFKALEAMAEQVKPEGALSTYTSTSSSNKTDKNTIKSRGSGSPFKCIGLGLAQQIKYEKVEELAAARLRIEELESLAVCRQKEIFSLNARLAAAESMTHDVIRDLLGVKLDMTTYVSLLDNQQVQKITEKAQFHASHSQEKEEEVVKLKKRLNEFIEERQGWLQEVDRKQAELVAAQIALEKLRQRDQSLKTENEILKMENVNNKNKALELEEEIKKLSGQQNLQQRIHHHAKIKEENNKLKIKNEELGTKLRRSETFLSRVKEELSSLRVSAGAGIRPCIDFEEEQRLMIKLKGVEEDKVLLAQQLLRLCTNVLKAAGITKPVSDINPSIAEEALEELENTIATLELEKQDLKYKNKVINERIRLSELMPQTSSVNSRTEENRVTPSKASQSPFLSSFDR
ncbi:hypothetical protein K1719_005083 [Acacia pycnantha]|nr:hypothetical protein K1719_005083 [Acacia pycnantha]